jgi:predicted transcriptional regulator of viral defense system
MKYTALKKHFQNLPFFTVQSLKLLHEPMRTLQNQLRLWIRQGSIFHLRRGMYTLSDADRTVTADPLVISANMVSPSYVSLEWALSHYGLIPEQARQITAVTTQKTQHYVTPLGTFLYRHIKTELFNGFYEERTSEGFTYLIATPEKALFDFLYYQMPMIHLKNTDIFESSYRFQNLAQMDWNQFMRYVKTSNSKKMFKIANLIKSWAHHLADEISV